MSLNNRLIARFGNRASSWRARRWILRRRFSISRRLFGVSYAASQTRAQARFVPPLLREAVLPVGLALVVVIGIAALDGSIASLVEPWQWPAMDSNEYAVLMEATTAATGVFLALYFTALSTVAASVYANVPHDIRALVIRDRPGNVYVSGVSFTMALSLLLLIVNVLTGETYLAAPVLIGLLAAFSIFAFVQLGQRAFYLFDPTLLAGTLAAEFDTWQSRSEFDARRSSDEAFQDHYRRQASKTIASLATLVELAGERSHLSGASDRRITSATTGTVVRYLSRRNQIPTTSKWFGERYEHKQWYLTDSTELEMATETASGLTPRSVPDLFWVENELLAPLTDLLNLEVSNQQLIDAYSTVSSFERVSQAFGATWSVSESTKWTNRITEILFEVLKSEEPLVETDAPGIIPGIWDAVSMLPLASELGFHRSVAARSVESISADLDAADWSSKSASHMPGLPREVIKSLEEMQKGVKFESDVKAVSVTRTPNWYIREIALHVYEKEFKKQVEAQVDFLSKWYPSAARRLTASGFHNSAGAVLARGIEIAWKLDRHIDDWEEIAANLRSGPLRVDVIRPTWDWTGIRKRVQQLQGELIRQLGASIPAQALKTPTNEVPDFLGHATHLVGEACFDALVRNDEDLFKTLFPTYLLGIRVVIDRIRPQVTDWQPSPAISAIAEPIVDAMDLSGYAMIFSEFHENSELWDSCAAAWKAIFDSAPAEFLTSIAAMHAYQRNLFAITHRAIGRTKWQMTLNNLLRALPREESQDWYRPGAVVHGSRLVRRIAPHDDFGMSSFHASDLFAVRFLKTLPGGQELDFGVADWVEREITDSVDQEEES